MERKKLKKWLEEKIGSIRKWNQCSASLIKKDSLKNNIYEDIIKYTVYLNDGTKFTERIYHILNDLYELQICCYCGKNRLIFYSFKEGYKNCCKNKICIAKYKRVNVDENGLSGFDRAKIKSSETKSMIGEDGLTIPQRAAEKQKKTKMMDIDEDGLNCYQRSAIKGSYTKYTNVDSEGLNIHQKSGLKTKKSLEKIDENSGIKKSELRAINGAKTRLDDIDEDGLNSYQRSAIKTKNTRLDDIDEDGLNSYQRASLKTVETIKNKIYDSGLKGYQHIFFESNKTRTLNNSLGIGYFSKECYEMINEINRKFQLETKHNINTYYLDDKNKREWSERNINENINYVQYDFVVKDIASNSPILVVEYHGSHVHINKEMYNLLVEENRDETDPFGNSLRKSYEKDQIKKQHMINKYGCGYVEVFDYDWKNNNNETLNRIQYILEDKNAI